MSILLMGAKFFYVLVLAWLLVGCTVWRVPDVPTVVLVAPFEGQFREIGYEALYAVRLAIADDSSQVRLLAIDDGGTPDIAATRIEALRYDASIAGVIVLGANASSEQAQAELNGLPMIIAGYWDAVPVTESTVILANSTLANETVSFTDIMLDNTQADIVGSDIFSLSVMPALLNTEQIRILSSGQLPTDAFRERYTESDLFVPEPRQLAMLAYDATGILLDSIREDVPLNTIRYNGLSGEIMFSDGYWQDAPLYQYRFDDDGNLVQSDG